MLEGVAASTSGASFKHGRLIGHVPLHHTGGEGTPASVLSQHACLRLHLGSSMYAIPAPSLVLGYMLQGTLKPDLMQGTLKPDLMRGACHLKTRPGARPLLGDRTGTGPEEGRGWGGICTTGCATGSREGD